MTAIGIDFGTTNSVVAVHSGAQPEVITIDNPPIEWAPYEFDKVFPSVMARDDNRHITFGWTAKQRMTGRFDAVKRMFATQQDVSTDDQGESLAVEEIATMLFAELKQRTIRAGVQADQAVVTVPANSKGLARHRTKIAAGMAGLEVLALINEPTAAAMTYAQRHPEARQLLVFDWGGGTLDVTVLQSVDGIFIEQASAGIARSGGIDFDSKIIDLIREFYPGLSGINAEERQRLRFEVELAKVKLSTQEVVTIQLPNGTPFELTRARFEKAIAGLIRESLVPIEECLGQLKIGLGGLDALVLVGGTCRIPAVRRAVTEYLKMEADPSINAMTAIGEGAAIAAAIMTGQIRDSDFFVCLEHSLGTWITDKNTGNQYFSGIIPRGHKLPATRSDQFFPIDPDHGQVSVEVVEGNPESKNSDFTVLKQWDVKLHEPYEPGSARDLTLEYSYDVDGILRVRATDNASGAILLDDDVSYGVARDKRQLKAMSERAKAAVSSGTVSEASRVQVNDAEAARLVEQVRVKIIPFLDSGETGPVNDAVSRLDSASTPSEIESAKSALKKLIAPFSYLL